jgi:predicted amidohydrolase
LNNALAAAFAVQLVIAGELVCFCGMARLLGVAQLCSSLDKAANLAICTQLVRAAKAEAPSCRFVAFPEAFEFMGRPGSSDSVEAAEELAGPTLSAYRELARREEVWLSLGGFHERVAGSSKIANTHVIVDAQGAIVETYRKLHLFDVDVDGGYRESDSTVRGDRVVVARGTPVGDVGVTTCYDVRFPALYSALRDLGADVMLIPSAFMPTTGKAHWHTLLRARAIETQCFVVASAQAGVHNAPPAGAPSAPGPRLRESYGHSLVVDPWGTVLCDLGQEAPSVRVVDLDFDAMHEVRRRMPAQQHRWANAGTVASSTASSTSSTSTSTASGAACPQMSR